MNVLRLSPVLLSALLMAAHASRHDWLLATIASLAFPLILLMRRPWVPVLVQVALVLGALEWVRTTVVLARDRAAAGEPWIRMAVILGTVAAVTAASALVFRLQELQNRYTRA